MLVLYKLLTLKSVKGMNLGKCQEKSVYYKSDSIKRNM